MAVAKEVFEDWNEQRKEAAEQRKAYNREKDTRFEDVADQALDSLEKRGITTDRDGFETDTSVDVEPIPDTVTTVEPPKAPTSWKELAELEARNRAAEQLANISEASGDAKTYDADDFGQFSDTHRSLAMIMYMFQMRIIHIHRTKAILMSLKQHEILKRKEPRFSYQDTTMGPLETNHGAIASAVPGTVLLLVL